MNFDEYWKEYGSKNHSITSAAIAETAWKAAKEDSRQEEERAKEEAKSPTAFQRKADEYLASIESGKEEILRAFVAKFGFHPEDAEQVQIATVDGCSWSIRRKEDREGLRELLYRMRNVLDGLSWYSGPLTDIRKSGNAILLELHRNLSIGYEASGRSSIDPPVPAPCPSCKGRRTIPGTGETRVHCPECSADGMRDDKVPELVAPLGSNRWRYNQDQLFCGTLRLMRGSWDTAPTEEFKKELMGWACEVLNREAEKNPMRDPHQEFFEKVGPGPGVIPSQGRKSPDRPPEKDPFVFGDNGTCKICGRLPDNHSGAVHPFRPRGR
jgi:hypothetical protein